MALLERQNDVAANSQNARELQATKAQIHRRLLETMDLAEARRMPIEQLHEECSRRANMLLNEHRCPLTGPERQRLLREVMDEIFGLGPVEELLRDPTISDILVNGPDKVYIERNGRLLRINDLAFRDDSHLIQVIQRIGANVGRRIDESCPMLDARLADGSRVNAVIPPLAIDGPAMSIRRFGTIKISAEELIDLGTMAKPMADFMEMCVRCRVNILISGGTGAGKTTLLNVLSHWIPDQERMVTIEDAAELRLQREHVVRLETRPPNIEGKGEVTQRDLLRNALRMRPDRIIIGEVRGPEAFDMLQAMNTGHEGSMTTVHANNPRDATRRIENMVSMAGLNYPIHVIRQQMSSALDLLVQIERLTGGKRRITHIAEITGMETDQFSLQNIFVFKQTGVDAHGHAAGHFESCGVRPQLLQRFKAEGIELPAELFQRQKL
jgi:pilus assembly protein CpaF